MGISGTGNIINPNKDSIRAARINGCLNKSIRNFLAGTYPFKKVRHWQKILIKYYGVEDVELDTQESQESIS